MKLIPLSQGKFAQVDDEDYDYLMQWKWTAHKECNIWYAIRIIRLPNGKQKRIAMHREIMNTPDDMIVDHRDHDGLNNQRSNIRNCTSQQNNANRRKIIKGYSNHIGVTWNKSIGRWKAQIGHNNKNIHIGSFGTEIEAALAYNKVAKELYKDFASFNVVKPILIKRLST